MPQYPIPTDWNGIDWECIIIEWPFSVEWFGILRGLVTTPLRGRFWDGSTGSIIDAQAIGREIEERNPVKTCEEIVIALQGIQVAVENLDVSADLQVAIQTNIQNNISLVASAVADSLALQSVDLVAASNASAVSSASAFAWSKAIAETTTSITIINNTQNQFRPIDITVDPPPQPQEAIPTGITSTPDSTDPDEICKRAYWMVRDLKEYLIYLNSVHTFTAKTVLGLSGMLADALWVAGFRANAGAARFLIPAAVFLSVSHNLQTLLFEGITPFQDLEEWIIDEFDNLVCEVAQAVETEQSTEAIQQLFIDSMTAYPVNSLYHFLPLLVVNLSTIAALYWVSSELTVLPPIPPFEPANICTFCGA